MESLQSAIERLASQDEKQLDRDARQTFMDFRDELTKGKIRAAEKIDGKWVVNTWVKLGILLGFRLGELSESRLDASLSFVDKDTYPARRFTSGAGVSAWVLFPGPVVVPRWQEGRLRSRWTRVCDEP